MANLIVPEWNGGVGAGRGGAGGGRGHTNEGTQKRGRRYGSTNGERRGVVTLFYEVTRPGTCYCCLYCNLPGTWEETRRAVRRGLLPTLAVKTFSSVDIFFCSYEITLFLSSFLRLYVFDKKGESRGRGGGGFIPACPGRRLCYFAK